MVRIIVTLRIQIVEVNPDLTENALESNMKNTSCLRITEEKFTLKTEQALTSIVDVSVRVFNAVMRLVWFDSDVSKIERCVTSHRRLHCLFSLVAVCVTYACFRLDSPGPLCAIYNRADHSERTVRGRHTPNPINRSAGAYTQPHCAEASSGHSAKMKPTFSVFRARGK